jgi:hypothetical protein
MLRAGVDTGFTQHLCLPYETILALNLAYRYPMEMELGDGSIAPMGVYDGWIEWEGDFRTVPVNKNETTYYRHLFVVASTASQRVFRAVGLAKRVFTDRAKDGRKVAALA